SRQAPPARQLANAHVLFNALGVLFVAPLVPLAATWLERFLPDTPAPVAQASVSTK
ncbi:MAG: hypothetical protein H7Y12_02045, partial [Sphingobacteriaceae bacterium]|nr:hypothetical protein [Cytophagaceae bacterium]